MSQLNAISPWTHIIGLLSEIGRSSLGTGYYHARSKRAMQRSIARWPEDVKISVLDRVSDHSVAIAWCHACSGYYGSQVWRESISRGSAICALSGERVARGDRIYKLSRSKQAPSNARAVLLASHVDAILENRNELEDSDNDYQYQITSASNAARLHRSTP